jgi:hypothetical protein
MPLLPPLVLEVGNGSKFQLLPHFHIVRPSSGSPKELGSASKVFILHIDWSALGISDILGQFDEDGKEYVITYTTQNNNKAESNYSSYKGKCLTVVWVIIHFKPYLYGSKFTLYTNH